MHEVHQKVVELNQDEDFVRYGMTLEQKLADQYDDGREEGKSEGLQEGIRGTVNILRGFNITDDEISSESRMNIISMKTRQSSICSENQLMLEAGNHLLTN